MSIRAQLLKKWMGPDPGKHIGSTALVATARSPCCACDAAWHVRVCAQAAEEPPAMRPGKCEFVRRPTRNLLRCGLVSASLCAGRLGTSCDAAWQVRVCAQAAEEPSVSGEPEED